MRVKISIIIMLIYFNVLFSLDLCRIKTEINDYMDKSPIKFKIEMPEFHDKEYDIRDFGASQSLDMLNTDAIQKAIDECSNNGGGRVIIPPGYWLTGPIEIKSDVNLHLERGAILAFTEDHTKYPLVRLAESNVYTNASPIYAFCAENVAITGEGIIDGNGDSWRPVKKYKLTNSQWNKLVSRGGVVNRTGDIWWPNKDALESMRYFASVGEKDLKKEDYLKMKEFLRPYMVYIVNCDRVIIDGVILQNSPSFALHVVRSENIIVRNVKVTNEWWFQNADGLDFSSCRNVVIYKNIVNTGDDAICLKSGRTKHFPKNALPTKNVLVVDNVIYHGHGGFVIGSNASGGIRNVYVANNLMTWTDTGLRFKSGRDRGGKVENIIIENIRMREIQREAVIFNMYYEDDTSTGLREKIKKRLYPEFKNIIFKDIICDGAEQALYINDQEENFIHNIQFVNLEIKARKGLIAKNTKNIKIQSCRFYIEDSPLFYLRNCKNIKIDDISSGNSLDTFLYLEGELTKSIEVGEFEHNIFKNKYRVGDGAKLSEIIKMEE